MESPIPTDGADVLSIASNDLAMDPMQIIFKRADERKVLHEMSYTRFQNVSYYSIRGDPGSLWPPLSSSMNQGSDYDTTVNKDLPASADDLYEANSNYEGNVSSSSRVHVATGGPLYQPLHSGSLVRLLEVEAGDFEAPLTFHFHYADLRQAHPQYEAISYVWGEEPSYRWENEPWTGIASCGDQSVEISINLATALRYLRRRSQNRLIWVDALCINQADTKERGHQVTLMSSIYRQAKHVVVWLHDEVTHGAVRQSPESLHQIYGQHFLTKEDHDRHGSRLFEAVCMVVNSWLAERKSDRLADFVIRSYDSGTSKTQKPFQQYFLTKQCLTDPISPDIYRTFGESYGRISWNREKMPSLWQAIEDLYRCPWFWRVWIVQEIVLARHAIAKFGNVEINWHWIGLAAAILRTNYHSNVKSLSIGGVYNAYLLFRMSKMSDLKPVELTFLQLLRLTRQLSSKDPRDRVYGLLGIKTLDNDPENERLLVQPDYDISCGTLWHRLACRFIHNTSSLNMLSSVQHAEVRGKLIMSKYPGYGRDESLQAVLKQGFPSWVPRWDYFNRVSLQPWDSEERFLASGSISLDLRQPPETGSLIIQAVRVGAVGCIFEDYGALLLGKHFDEFFQTKAGIHLLHRTLSAGRDSYGLLISESVPTSLGFLSDMTHQYSSLPTSLRPESYARAYIENYIDINASLDDKGRMRGDPVWRNAHDHAKAAEESEQARQFMNNRSLCLTINGYLVLAPNLLHEGDILCVLAGADLPVLLRPYDVVASQYPDMEIPPVDCEKSDYPRYVVIGDCYVEGLMYGEINKYLESGDPAHGPVPDSPILNHILEVAAKNVSPFHHDEKITGSQLSNLLAAGKDAINQELKRRVELEWIEIV